MNRPQFIDSPIGGKWVVSRFGLLRVKPLQAVLAISFDGHKSSFLLDTDLGGGIWDHNKY